MPKNRPTRAFIPINHDTTSRNNAVKPIIHIIQHRHCIYIPANTSIICCSIIWSAAIQNLRQLRHPNNSTKYHQFHAIIYIMSNIHFTPPRVKFNQNKKACICDWGIKCLQLKAYFDQEQHDLSGFVYFRYSSTCDFISYL